MGRESGSYLVALGSIKAPHVTLQMSTVDRKAQKSPCPQLDICVESQRRKSSQGLSVFNWMMVRWDWEPIVAAVVVLVPAAAVVVLLPNHVSWESGQIGWSCLVRFC